MTPENYINIHIFQVNRPLLIEYQTIIKLLEQGILRLYVSTTVLLSSHYLLS